MPITAPPKTHTRTVSAMVTGFIVRSGAASAAEQACLDLRIRRVCAEPYRQQCPGAVIALDGALARSVEIDGYARARLMNEGHLVAGFHIGHPAVERIDALLQRGKLVF